MGKSKKNKETQVKHTPMVLVLINGRKRRLMTQAQRDAQRGGQ